MNQRVSFNEKMAVERLVPLPQYSCYTELINTGVQCINTSIFTDMDILNLHFYQLLDLFKDGIETDQIQTSVILVTFTDGETVKLSVFDYWFNLLFWGLPVSSNHPIDSRYLWYYEDITQDSIADYINSTFLKLNRQNYTNMQINNMIDDVMYKFQFIDKFSLFLYNTSNNEDTIELMLNNKDFYDCIHCDLSNIPIEDVKDTGIDKFSLFLYNTSNNEDTIELMLNNKDFYDCIHCDLSNIPIEDVKDTGMKITKRGVQHILDSGKHWAIPYFKAKEGINIKQYREFQFNIGTVPDGNGGVYPLMINGNYANRGISDPALYAIDADKARIAQVLSHQNVGTSGAFARILGLNNMDDRLHPDPHHVCDSKHFVQVTIKDAKTLSMYKGRWYRFTPDGVEYQMSLEPIKDNIDLVGKTLLFRSPITCASRSRGHGICYRCYGGLSHTNNDINIGKIAAELLSSLLTQRLLSAKHLLETNIKKLMWNENFYTFFEINYSMIKLKDDTSYKKFKIILDPMEDDEELEDDIDPTLAFNTYVTGCTIIDPKGNEYYISTSDEDSLYLSPELNSIINKKTPDSDGLYILDLDSLKDKNLFYIEVVNNELGRTLEKIKNILNKNAEVRRLVTKDAITQALVDTIIEGGLNIDAIHLEIILSHQCKSYESNLIEPEWQYRNATYRMITLNEALKDNKSITISLMYKDINKLLFYPLSNLIEPEWQYRNATYRMITLNEALKDNKSITISLMYKDINKLLFYPLSFMKSDPSVMDLFYMTKPQMYMSMEPVESNLVDDKEVEGPIRPFVFAEPPVMFDDED